MLKKIGIVVFFVFFMLGCSSLNVKNELSNEPSIDKVRAAYEKWEVDIAESELIQYENKYGISEESEKVYLQILERSTKKEELFHLVEVIKGTIIENKTSDLKKYANGFFIKKKIKELSKYDFSGFEIYSGNFKFKKENAECVFVANYLEESIYITVKFRLKNNRWELVDFKERR